MKSEELPFCHTIWLWLYSLLLSFRVSVFLWFCSSAVVLDCMLFFNCYWSLVGFVVLFSFVCPVTILSKSNAASGGQSKASGWSKSTAVSVEVLR